MTATTQAGDARGPLVLVTGSSGLLGSRIVADLARDHRVVGLDVQPPASDTTPMTRFVECDLTAEAGAREALETVTRAEGRRIASVVHLAAYYDFSGEPSPLYQELTVEGTRRLLRALRASEVEQVVFSSSLLVHAPAEARDTRLDERSPLHAEWDYPQSKIEAERALRGEHGAIPVVILRIAGVYDDVCHSIPVAQQIRRIHEKQLESVVFPGDATRGQSWVHVDDLVECVRRVVERRSSLGSWETFLVGEPGFVSYAALQERLGELIHGREWPTLRIPAPLAKAGAWVKDKLPGTEDPFIKPWMIDQADAHYPVSIQHAKDRLGWIPSHRLLDTLPRMVESLERDPAHWYREHRLPLPRELRDDESQPDA